MPVSYSHLAVYKRQAMNHAGVADDLSYVSTAGGAFLEWMDGKALPGVEALRKR